MSGSQRADVTVTDAVVARDQRDIHAWRLDRVTCVTDGLAVARAGEAADFPRGDVVVDDVAGEERRGAQLAARDAGHILLASEGEGLGGSTEMAGGIVGAAHGEKHYALCIAVSTQNA
jgi:hypothetical protein